MRKHILKNYKKNKRNHRIEVDMIARVRKDINYAFGIQFDDESFTPFYRYKLENFSKDGIFNIFSSSEAYNTLYMFLKEDGIEYFIKQSENDVEFDWARGNSDFVETTYSKEIKVLSIEDQPINQLKEDNAIYFYSLKEIKLGDTIEKEDIFYISTSRTILGLDQKDKLYFDTTLKNHFTKLESGVYPIYQRIGIQISLKGIDEVRINAPAYTHWGANKLYGAKKDNVSIVPLPLKKFNTTNKSPDPRQPIYTRWFSHPFLNNSNQLLMRSEWMFSLWSCYAIGEAGNEYISINAQPGGYPNISQPGISGAVTIINTTKNKWADFFNLWDYVIVTNTNLGDKRLISDSWQLGILARKPSNYDFLVGVKQYASFKIDSNSAAMFDTFFPATKYVDIPHILTPLVKENWGSARDFISSLMRKYTTERPSNVGFQWYDGTVEEEISFYWILAGWPGSTSSPTGFWKTFWKLWQTRDEGEYYRIEGTGIGSQLFQHKETVGSYDLKQFKKLALDSGFDTEKIENIRLYIEPDNFESNIEDIYLKVIETQSIFAEDLDIHLYRKGEFVGSFVVRSANSFDKYATKTRIIF